MKSHYLLLCFLLISFISFSQEAEAPTLSVGLESLTFGKGTIDVEALKKVVARKQNELKREGLKRFVFDRLPEYNYTSKLFLQSCILTILEEKNQDIVERELLELSTNYAIVLGFSELMYPYDRENRIKMPKVEEIWKEIVVDTIKVKPYLQRQLFIDFMGTVLSKNELLKERGFFDFDSRIDYRYSKLYRQLDTIAYLNSDRFKSLDSLLTSRVNGYLESYQFIREIINDKNYDKLKEKKDDFLNEAYRIIGDSTVRKSLNLQGESEYLRMIDIGKELKTFLEETNELNENIKKFNSYKVELSSLIEAYNAALNPVDTISLKNTTSALDSKFNTLRSLQTELIRTSKVIINTFDSQKLIASGDELKKSDAYEKIKNIRDKVGKMDFELLTEQQIKNLPKPLKSPIDSTYLSQIQPLNNFKFNPVSSLANLETTLEFIDSEFNLYKQSVEKSDIGRKNFLRQIINSVNKELISQNIRFEDSVSRRVYSKRLSQLYLKSKQIASKENLNIDDLIYLENNALPALVELKIIVNDSASDKNLEKIINATNAAIALSKYLEVDEELLSLQINEDIVSFLNFLGRINELDNASTFAYVIQILDETHNFIENTYLKYYQNEVAFETWFNALDNTEKKRVMKFEHYQAFKSLYNKLLNNIEKYTIIDEEKDIIEIDLVSFLESFVESFENSGEKRNFGLYFTVGISQNIFLNDNVPSELETIGFASEKIGVRYTLFHNEIDKPKNLADKPIQSYEFDKQSPFLNEIYLIGYGSGLLYEIADLTTDSSFDAPHVGTGVGFRFFNSLDINATIGFPFFPDRKFGEAPFVGISFDVPIGEYLSAIRGD